MTIDPTNDQRRAAALGLVADQLGEEARQKLPGVVAEAKAVLDHLAGNQGRATAALSLRYTTQDHGVVAALAAAALVELAGLERVDDVLRENGIEYPLGARGVRDLASQAAGRAEEQATALDRAEALIAKVREWRGQYLAAMAGNHDGILTANETLMAELGAYEAVTS
jgi:hypothetical protein